MDGVLEATFEVPCGRASKEAGKQYEERGLWHRVRSIERRRRRATKPHGEFVPYWVILQYPGRGFGHARQVV